MQFLQSKKTERIQADIDILTDAWIAIEKTRAEHPNKIDADVVVSFTKSKKTLVIPDRVSIRLTAKICHKMGWENGDSIVAFSHPDNVFLLKLCKSSARNGWKLQQDKKPNSYYRLIIKWHEPSGIHLDSTPIHPVNYQIYKECLLMDIMKDASEQ